MPVLQQEIGVQFPLLPPRLFRLIGVPLPCAECFKHFAFPLRLPVTVGRFPADRLKTANLFLHLNAQTLQLLAQQGGKVNFCRSASIGQCVRVGACRLFQEPLQPAERLLPAPKIYGSLLQSQCALALHTLAKPL